MGAQERGAGNTRALRGGIEAVVFEDSPNNSGSSGRCWHCGGWLGAVWWVIGVDDFVAGVGLDDDVAAVVDVVMAVWAGEAHGVDVCWSALFPGHDVMDFASFGTGLLHVAAGRTLRQARDEDGRTLRQARDEDGCTLRQAGRML